MHLLQTHGRPSFTKVYFRALLLDEEFHFVFGAFLLLSASPTLFALLPFTLRALIDVVFIMNTIHQRLHPSILSLHRYYVEGKVEEVEGGAGGNEWKYRGAIVPPRRSNKWYLWLELSLFHWCHMLSQPSHSHSLALYANLLDMIVFSNFVVIVILHRSHLMMAFMWFQYVRFRYMLSRDCKLAFQTVYEWLNPRVVHSSTPRFVQQLWSKLINFLDSLTDPQQQQQKSRCLVM